MNKFLHDDFLLSGEFAKTLYHEYAAPQPIIDYHCHLPPHEIANNRQYEDLTALWLAGDHYKWRAMRTLGVDEYYITGTASAKEKFSKWAYTVPYTIRNPLYIWTHLELKRYFGIDRLLDPDSADAIYAEATAKINTQDYNTRALLNKMNVEVVCTTDDPTDTLEHHKKIAGENIPQKVIPSFRPDKGFGIEDPTTYNSYLEKLSATSGIAITSFDTLLEALANRMTFFHENGCRLSDHGLEQLYVVKHHELSPEAIFQKVRKNETPDAASIQFFKYHVLLELCRLYHKHGWTQQFHLGALRNNNARMMRLLGPDTGFDSVGDFSQAVSLSKFLNKLDSTDQLCKTVLYNLNPADNEVMGTMIGNFNDGSIKGKMQFGTAWWFLDQRDGMEKQINALSNLGLLSCFVGMLTDSRSFLSFPRHEYFRRILCNLIAQDVDRGELPADEKWLGKIVADICYFNAKTYFGL